jgi:hypothetical protein
MTTMQGWPISMHLEAIERLARQSLHEHGLTQQGWTFEWDNAIRRFGYCRYSRLSITISKPLCALNTYAEAKDTILHEIAHALVGSGVGHGPTWVAQARAIGCNGQRCYNSYLVTRPPSKFIGTCPVCSGQIERNRRRRNLACLTCCRKRNRGQWDARFILEWTRREHPRADDE